MKIYNAENLPPEDSYLLREIKDIQPTKHICAVEFNAEEDGNQFLYGQAAYLCYEEDGRLHIENGEYKNPVLFCPFCGFAAKDLK